MKKVSAMILLSIALPLYGMEDEKVVHADEVARGLQNGTWPPPQEQRNVQQTKPIPGNPRGSSGQKTSRKKLPNTKRRDQESGKKKGSQSFNKDLISKTILSRALLPVAGVVASIVVLAASERRARRTGKQTMLQRVWQRMRRLMYGETLEKGQAAKRG